jgi:hypothetical protein
VGNLRVCTEITLHNSIPIYAEKNMMMGLFLWSTVKNLSVRETKEHRLIIISSGITLEQECTIHGSISRICPSEEPDMED